MQGAGLGWAGLGASTPESACKSQGSEKLRWLKKEKNKSIENEKRMRCCFNISVLSEINKCVDESFFVFPVFFFDTTACLKKVNSIILKLDCSTEWY